MEEDFELSFLKRVLTEIVFKSSSNDNDSLRITPTYFWEKVLLTWLLLNIKGEWGVFFNFRQKIIFCACLLVSGLKLVFHCNAQSRNFARSSFNSFAEVSTLKTTESSDLSSAKSFALEDKSFVKSLIYIKNRSDLKVDPCCINISPWRKSTFKSTLYFLHFRKSFIKLRSLSEIPFCFSLKIRSSSQTLSKALEIRRNQPELCSPYEKIGISCE